MTERPESTIPTYPDNLPQLLRALAEDEPASRRQAVNAIERMHESLLGEEDGFERFQQSVNAAVTSPQFDAARWLPRLVDTLVEAHAARMNLYRQETQRVDRVMDKLAKRIEHAATEEERRAHEKRVARVVCSGCDDKNVNEKQQAELGRVELMALLVMGGLNDAWLAAPDVLRRLWQHRVYDREAYRAVQQLGPRAIAFADELLTMLTAAPDSRQREIASALASVIREDPPRIRTLVQFLDAANPHAQSNALIAITELGQTAREHAPDVVTRLLALTRTERDNVALYATIALGRVTHGTDVAVDRLLELSCAEDLWIKGAALTALGDVGVQPARVVPRLIAAFDDYEEPDPDLTYDSSHQRVADAMTQFGPEAAPAIPAILQRLRPDDDPDTFDQGLVATLRAIGPAARDTLPTLEKLARELGYTRQMLIEDADFDELARTIAYFRNL